MLFVVLALVLVSCNGDNGGTDDAADDPQPDHVDDTMDAVEDTAPDPAQDPQEEDPVEEPAQDVVEEEGPPPQDPITFIIRNTSEDPVYLDWGLLGNNLVAGSRTTGGAFDPVKYWTPFCMAACEDHEPGGMCCMECLPPPTVKLLPADGEVEYEWDGESLYTTDADYCVCTCYRETAVTPMLYKAEVCVYASFDCFTEPCEPDADNIIQYSTPEGDPQCYDVEFDIPYAEDEVVIEVAYIVE
ncbi:MAG: hypothetical protein ABIJ56_01065 [Pseudomonadota bacterium]